MPQVSMFQVPIRKAKFILNFTINIFKGSKEQVRNIENKIEKIENKIKALNKTTIILIGVLGIIFNFVIVIGFFVAYLYLKT